MRTTAWVENITLPTYSLGKAEKNPIFLEKRVYQGSSGAVYPHPVVEKLLDEKVDKIYQAVFLENEYLKIMILPELGGRIHRAYDKVKKRDFIYYNQVIKPALVGLTGPWISGGIEFNWPQHHRPSTFDPIDFDIEEHEDGSKTVWVNEIEKMFRTKGRAGFTLYTDKAYLEIKGLLYNRTPFPQTFLWWANPAVKVNDYYQSIFPPDVYAVFDHGKRDVSDFPIATKTYYKVDYSPGTDISRYKNIPVPTSYMAIQSEFDFMGCYEHDTKAGMLHVANHHVSPGKKQWTWGNGDFGKAWDRNLTDEDGPYIELMTGMFTDNQPDFSWLQPYEEKTFEQYFMPYAEIGEVKNATKEAMVNLEVIDGIIKVQVYATAKYVDANISIFIDDQPHETFKANLCPSKIFCQEIRISSTIKLEEIEVIVKSAEEKQLVSYRPKKYDQKEMPLPASAAKHPSEILTVEELFLNGLHLEQYRHATYNPLDYYEEGLKREPHDIRCNNAKGSLLLRRGKFQDAEKLFRTAVKAMMQRNPNPNQGEPLYNLGWSLLLQNKDEEAYNYFYKCVWNNACQHTGYLSLARITCKLGQFDEALYLIDKSIIRNFHSHTARHLKVIILRKCNKTDEALAFAKDSLIIDLFNYGCYFEQYLLFKQKNEQEKSDSILKKMQLIMRNNEHNYLEYAFDYIHAGCYRESIELLNLFKSLNHHSNPMINYTIGWCFSKMENIEKAIGSYVNAKNQSSDYCFPHKIEEKMILEDVIKLCPNDAKAHYYLGNFWFDKKQYQDAIYCWERSINLDSEFPTAHRNLALAYFNKNKDAQKSLFSLEKAFSLDPADGRVLMELDQLYKILNYPLVNRLKRLIDYPVLTNYRDDLYLEKITLLNQIGHYQEAKNLLAVRKFHPWEGGEGKVVSQFLLANLELAKRAILKQNYDQALSLLAELDIYPENFGEGKLFGTPENDIDYLKGCAYEGLSLPEKAQAFFEKASRGNAEPVQAIFYNDAQPDKIFYQGLAWIKLNAPEKGKDVFNNLISFGKKHIDDHIKIDYFAVSLPDLMVFDQDLNLKNQLHCLYMTGLGELGLNNYSIAHDYFKQVLVKNINHQGAQVHINMILY
ncbi:DUF5107 domain-containing protein [Pedobacter sp. SD-b]|uniref:DUF5107 domain-containing protein n=1 Tax=Pedobacter segetis TaxID=2793069 RepID=A0ABS1BL16_9SPHI|nr:DUF5107 domain-containing protein [Pedobacter segetis]MBK0383585.1 DUF5107 domain-containing protein [Pedobacter segetis]